METSIRKIEGVMTNSQTSNNEEVTLDRWKRDIKALFIPKCSYCNRKTPKVVGQTEKGKYAEANNHLPRNWGFYCQRCYDEGMEIEREAMYGE